METSKTKKGCGQAGAKAAGQVGMGEPKKRQGSVLNVTSWRTRIRGRDAVNLSAGQGIAMHSLNSHATGPGDLEPASTNFIVVVGVVIEGVEELVVVVVEVVKS